MKYNVSPLTYLTTVPCETTQSDFRCGYFFLFHYATNSVFRITCVFLQIIFKGSWHVQLFIIRYFLMEVLGDKTAYRQLISRLLWMTGTEAKWTFPKEQNVSLQNAFPHLILVLTVQKWRWKPLQDILIKLPTAASLDSN